MKPHTTHTRLLLLVVALTSVTAFIFSRPAANTTESWLPSSFNPAPRGHKALFVTLQDLHWPVQRWQRSYRELSETRAVMILTRDASQQKTAFFSEEISQLLQWVHTGNDLVLLGDWQNWSDTRPLIEALHFPLPESASAAAKLVRRGPDIFRAQPEAVALSPGPAAGPEWRNTSLTFPAGPPLPPPPEKSEILWQNSRGEPYAVRLLHGAGHVTWITSPAMIDHQWLAQGSWPFVLSWLQPGGQIPRAVYFEERHHGFPTSYAVTDLWSQTGLRIASGQMLLGFLVFLVSSLQRFGPLTPLARPRHRSTMEFVHSMAQLYRRANLRNEIVQQLFDETRHRVLLKFNLPPPTSPEVVSARLQQAYPHLPRWKKLAERFELKQSPAGLPPGGWLKAAQDLIQIKREML